MFCPLNAFSCSSADEAIDFNGQYRRLVANEQAHPVAEALELMLDAPKSIVIKTNKTGHSHQSIACANLYKEELPLLGEKRRAAQARLRDGAKRYRSDKRENGRSAKLSRDQFAA